MTANGADPVRLTNNSARDESPAWSPDGLKIAFVSTRDGNREIYVMNVDGTNQTRLTTNSAEDNHPDWSPDGTQIAFMSNRDGHDQIYVMNADGSDQHNISDNAYSERLPDWHTASSQARQTGTSNDSTLEFKAEAHGIAPVELEALKPVVDPTISDVLVTNRRDVALTITWRTDQPSTGWVEYGEKTALGQTAYDDLGEGTVSQVHHVTLTGLTPETTYYFRVHSGESVDDNGGALYQVSTKETGIPPVPYRAYGQVETSDGQPAVGALVRARLVDGEEKTSEPLSALVDGYGYWALNLPVEACQGLEVRLQATGRQGGEASLTQPACEVKPAPAVRLMEEESLEIYLPVVTR
jgi:hypothetical protein